MQTDSSGNQEAAPTRLVSVDVLRGFAMLWILGADAIGGALLSVGNIGAEGGSESDGSSRGAGSSLFIWICHFLGKQLDHVEWEGFRFYDLIFPLFVFIIGVSLVFSLDKLKAERGFDAAWIRVMKRTVLLYALGIFYYGGWADGLDQVRLLGVLQRLALCYGAASLLHMTCQTRTLIWISGGILLGYWALLAWVPVPGIGAGGYEEGANLTNWFDSKFLPLRKWDGDYDPEGLLSTFPAVVSCLLGVFAGRFLKLNPLNGTQRALILIVSGLGLVLLGHAWGVFFPVIKKIWTSSYVLVAGGWSAILLGTLHYVVDIQNVRRWAQWLIWIGLNPIAVYMLGNLVDFDHLARRFVGGNIESGLDLWLPGLGGLLVAIVGIGWGICAAWYLHRKRVYLRI
jgi:predicted acyltransferase